MGIDTLIDKAKDFGRSLFGQEASVRFKKDTLLFERTHGVSHEQAKKGVLAGRIDDVHREIGLNGTLGERDPQFQEFIGSLEEMFDTEAINRFIADSKNPAIFRHVAVAPALGVEIVRAEKRFLKNFKKNKPAVGIVRDSVENAKIIRVLMGRFYAELSTAGPDSIEQIVETHPEMGADLGKIIEAKKIIDKHEREFGMDLRFEGAMENFKDTALNSVMEMIWRAPIDCLLALSKTGIKPNKVNTMVESLMKQFSRLALREVVAVTKFSASAANAFGSFLRNKVVRKV
jgi:hypothetical protein